MRIISLIASATEIICKLGFEKQLVGRSHECDFPATITCLPKCSSPKIDVSASSFEIDRQVKDVVRKSLSVYNVDTEKLRELDPDVIVTQDHCEVCAVNLKDVEKAVCDWLDKKPRIVSLRPNNLSDIWLDIKNVAQALGVPVLGDELVSTMINRMTAISNKAKSLDRQPSVACIEWLEPLMAAGNWIPELVAMLGANDLFGQPGVHSPWLNWETFVDKDPDYIITMPCGWGLERSRRELSAITTKPDWEKLKAVKNSNVYLTDGNQFFNRPSPRLVESMEILAEILYPEDFSFDHTLSWKRL